MSKNKSWVIGNTITLRSEYRIDNVLTDPTTAVVTVEDPAGATTTPTVAGPETGVKTAAYVCASEGYHKYRWVGTGTAAGIEEGTFYVHSSALA